MVFVKVHDFSGLFNNKNIGGREELVKKKTINEVLCTR